MSRRAMAHGSVIRCVGEGPAVVLANGLGGTYVAFRYLYEALGDYKTICWDYRGLYTSSPSRGSPREHDRASGR